MEIRIKRVADVPLPQYANKGDAGFDLHAAQEAVLQPGERKLISSGIKMAIPLGYEAQIRPRSGLALNHGISLVNTPGTIDCSYRGIVGILLINHGNESFSVEKGMRIAQVVINKIESVDLKEVDSLDETERGEGGFGSTGL